MSTTVSHPLPSAQDQAIADLTGYEDAATLRWQQACVQAANTLTALPNGRYVTVRMERMRQGLELAQRGAVTLPEDGEELSAVVRSGSNVYQVDTRLLTCTCADYQKHLQACKHLLAVEIHLGALGLLPPDAPEPAAAEPEPAQASGAHGSGTEHRELAHQRSARLAQHQAQDRPHGVHVHHAGCGRSEAAAPGHHEPALAQDILHGCEANLAARQQEAERSRQQAEEERQAQARSLDEQIAAAVAAAMQAQASRTNGHSPQQHTAAAPPQPPEAEGLASAHDHDPSWCPKHQVTMRWHEGNARGPGWFSHQLADGSYCKGK